MRTFKPLHSYFAYSPATTLDISQRGLLAVGYGRKVQVGRFLGFFLWLLTWAGSSLGMFCGSVGMVMFVAQPPPWDISQRGLLAVGYGRKVQVCR